MFLLDDTVVYSASDLTMAAGCEFAVLRRLDEKLGRVPKLEVVDPMRDRAARLGDQHEIRILDQFRERFGAGVVEIAVPDRYDRSGLEAQQERTFAALKDGADVVFQGGFFDGRFHGRSDFLVRDGEVDGQPRYAVFDTKLARSAKSPAILQLAAYADQLLAAGIPVTAETHLHLGNDVVTSHDTADTVGIFREHRRHVQALLDEHLGADGPLTWGDERYAACLWCDYCKAELEPSRDVRLTWGLRATHRTALRAVGITTIDQLAASTAAVPKIRPASLAKLRAQAALQLLQEAAEASGSTPAVFSEVHSVEALDALPAPDDGDLFFDFEGDPMWVDGDRSTWGLEYLFGIVEAGPTDRFVPFWAHDRADEKAALEAFLGYVLQRRAAHPGLHIYHYAFYEQSALRQLARRHGVGAGEVEALLADGVLVDLYQVVKDSVRVSQRSYSIKKLEPLYMGDQLRDADGVTSGGDSVVAYEEACTLRDAGDVAGFEARLAELADYNTYDCVSTKRLRDWLLVQRDAAHAEELATAVTSLRTAVDVGEDVRTASNEPDPRAELAAALAALAAIDGGDGDPAVPLLAAALEYHRRENDPFWQAHFERLSAHVFEWADTRDVLDVYHSRVREDWFAGRGRQRRQIEVVGRLGTGSTLAEGSEVFCVYHPPLPPGMNPPERRIRATSMARVLTREVTASGLDRLILTESLPKDVEEHRGLPVLVTPGPPPRTEALVAAIEAVARTVAGPLPDTPAGPEAPDSPAAPAAPAAPGALESPVAPTIGHAALDILRAIPPRMVGGGPLPEPSPLSDGSHDDIRAVTEAILRSDDSYVAVQGPPGTGKTYLGTRVIARLVTEHRWRVGVVAQSHAVVEHFLDGVISAGIDPRQVAKRVRDTKPEDLAAAGLDTKSESPAPPSWTSLDTYGHMDFHERMRGVGAVIGGTAWDFANRRRFDIGALDLLVVDEAGQFALANTVAVSTAARRLLLLGDPQQLPQVSQGTHDAPVHVSALSWLAQGHEALPATHGFFLDRTWRMHPELCIPVSALAYDHQLHSHPRSAERHLDGLEPGVHVVTVSHRGNVVDSPEESEEVLAQISALLGRTWVDGGERTLEQNDVLVVAAYNAQVQRIRRDLVAAGLPRVRVGTVDKLQGQEAAVVVLSLAASSADDAPRGLAFLLSRNRINVAISRGKWAAIIVRSLSLTRHLPSDPDELSELGAFVALCSGAHERRPRRRLTGSPVSVG